MPERTLLLIKPDGVERRLVGEILGRVERKGLTIATLELRTVSEKLAKSHYAEHDGKPFFGSLVEFITSSPLVAAIIEGPRAIAAIRQLAGGTDPVEKACPAPSAAISASKRSTTWCTAPIRRSPQSAKSRSGSARLDNSSAHLVRPGTSVWDTD